MIKKISRLRALIRRKDYRTIIFSLLAYLPQKVFVFGNFYFVKCTDINTKYMRKQNNNVSITVRDASLEQLQRLREDMDIDLSIISFQIGEKIDSVKIITLEKEGRYIGCALTKKDNVLKSPSGFKIDLGNNSYITWLFGMYVKPEYRLKGYIMNLISTAYDCYRLNGTACLMGEIFHLNKNSIMAHYRLGFEVYKNIFYLKIFNKSIYWEGEKRFWCVPSPSNGTS